MQIQVVNKAFAPITVQLTIDNERDAYELSNNYVTPNEINTDSCTPFYRDLLAHLTQTLHQIANEHTNK